MIFNMNNHKAYLVVITLELTCIGIQYNGVSSEAKSFQQPSLIMLLFLAALFSHIIAFNADLNMLITIITFHVSGIIACETLLYILLVHFLWYCIINLFLFLLLASFCFVNYLIKKLRGTSSYLDSVELQQQATQV